MKPSKFKTKFACAIFFAVFLAGCGGGGSGTSTGNGNTTGTNTSGVTNHHAYAVDLQGSTISQFNIGADGALAKMSTPQVNIGGLNPTSIAIGGGGKFAYVVAQDGYLFQYNIGSNGSVTPMTSASFAIKAWDALTSVRADITGQYLYAADATSGEIYEYRINNTNGSLGLFAKIMPNTLSPQSIVIEPSGKYVYVANAGGTVSQFSIDDNTMASPGNLRPMTPMTVAAGNYPVGVAVTPSSKFAYVVNKNGDNVSQFAIGASGGLTPLAVATVSTGKTPTSIVIDPTGSYAYVTNGYGSSISQYTIGSGGALTPMATPTIATHSWPHSAKIDPTGKFLYTANMMNTISMYSIGADGALTAMTPPTVASGANSVELLIN